MGWRYTQAWGGGTHRHGVEVHIGMGWRYTQAWGGGTHRLGVEVHTGMGWRYTLHTGMGWSSELGSWGWVGQSSSVEIALAISWGSGLSHLSHQLGFSLSP